MARGIMAFTAFWKRDQILAVDYGCLYCRFRVSERKAQNAFAREAHGRQRVRAHVLEAHPIRCEACGIPYVRDPLTNDDTPALKCEETCWSCARCGTRSLNGGPNACEIADSDEEAAKHDPDDLGACAECWRVLRATGAWPRGR